MTLDLSRHSPNAGPAQPSSPSSMPYGPVSSYGSCISVLIAAAQELVCTATRACAFRQHYTVNCFRSIADVDKLPFGSRPVQLIFVLRVIGEQKVIFVKLSTYLRHPTSVCIPKLMGISELVDCFHAEFRLACLAQLG